MLNKLNRLLLTNDDPLSADVGDKDLTKYPLLPANRLLKFEVRQPEKKPTTKDPSAEMLVIPLVLRENGVVSTAGDSINEGFVITHRIMITPTDKRTPNQIARDIGGLCQALGVTGMTVRQVIDNPSCLDGKIGMFKTKINPEKDGYPESNSLVPVPAA